MEDPTKYLTTSARVVMSRFAKSLNSWTNGRLKPSHITTLSLLGHFPAAWALWAGKPVLAAILIGSFGILDALDGALAREQGSSSKFGMFYDSVTDRMKEILVFTGLAVYITYYIDPSMAWLAAAAVGTSILVSYIRARGESVMFSSKLSGDQSNKVFTSGIARYEVRTALVIIGLLLGSFLLPLLRLIIALNIFTAAGRFFEVTDLLKSEDRKPRKDHAKK